MKTLAGLGFLLIVMFELAPNAVAQIKRPDEPVALPSPFDRSQEINFSSRYPMSGGIPIKREPKVLKEGLLAPSVQDRLEHDAFLKQSKTGLIRLMPREVYDSESYQVAFPIDILGGGAYFSFFHRAHEYGYGSDLELSRNKFSVGFAGQAYGMIVNLGDVPIDKISETDPQYVFMADHKPGHAGLQAARAEPMRFNNGVPVGTSRRTVLAKSQSTYLLRSIDFGRSDVLVAFRVVRFDNDGGAIIAWKLLKTFSTPRLKR